MYNSCSYMDLIMSPSLEACLWSRWLYPKVLSALFGRISDWWCHRLSYCLLLSMTLALDGFITTNLSDAPSSQTLNLQCLQWLQSVMWALFGTLAYSNSDLLAGLPHWSFNASDMSLIWTSEQSLLATTSTTTITHFSCHFVHGLHICYQV